MTARTLQRSTRRAWAFIAVAALLLALLPGASTAGAQANAPVGPDHPVLQPIDAQNWVDQAELTWDDYTQVRPDEWHDTAVVGSQDQYRGAVILLDFTDQPFLITQEPETHPFGNPRPGHQPVPAEQVRQWMEDYLQVPSEINGGQNIHSYWMENTHGRLGVEIEAFGPYTLPGKLHEYGMADFAPTTGPSSRCPLGDVCNKNIRTDGQAMWFAEQGPQIALEFDFIFFTTAAHDESSTWQEQGEMIFESRDDIPAAFGPPGAEDGPVLNNAGQPMPNWSPTRYVEWTSWRSAASHWPNAAAGSSTQAESTGQSVYAHEFSHIRGLPDNYNNPFADNIRNYSGYWEMMSRGTFNGPGGTHNRWQVPNQGGSGLGPHHMLHFKRQLGVLDDEDQVLLEREELPASGIAVATIKARSSIPAGDQVGLRVNLGGSGYQSGQCQDEEQARAAREGRDPAPSFWCPPGTNWLHYDLEVVDRVGNDSFTPGHGVLLAQTRNSGTPRIWLLDPNSQDINMVDFYRPDGTPVPVVRGDPRQLNDATWHAGTGSGSQFEYVESYNRLHFYILDAHRGADGALRYDVAVRHLDGAGEFARGVSLGDAAVTSHASNLSSCTFPVTNTGLAGAGVFDSDVYRLSATSDSADWQITLPNALAAAASGETVDVAVHALRTAADGAQTATVTLTATSESDPGVTATRACQVDTPNAPPSPSESPTQGPTPGPSPNVSPGPLPGPTQGPSPSPSPGGPGAGPAGEVLRHGGAARIETAVAVSRSTFSAADTVVIARADDYPDALAGAPLAVHRGAPLLLSEDDRLTTATAGEISRLGARNAVLLGGEAALSAQVRRDLEALGVTVERIGGRNRFGTAARVMGALPDAGEVFIVEGQHADPSRGWPDALSASGLAASERKPVLLVVRDQLPDETASALSDDDEVLIIGGSGAVSDGVAAEIDRRVSATRRIFGPNRYATSVAMAAEAQARGATPVTTWLATGRAFPDGLVSTAAAGMQDGIMLLVDGMDIDLSQESLGWLSEHASAIDRLHLAGAASAISTETESRLRRLLEAS